MIKHYKKLWIRKLISVRGNKVYRFLDELIAIQIFLYTRAITHIRVINYVIPDYAFWSRGSALSPSFEREIGSITDSTYSLEYEPVQLMKINFVVPRLYGIISQT